MIRLCRIALISGLLLILLCGAASACNEPSCPNYGKTGSAYGWLTVNGYINNAIHEMRCKSCDYPYYEDHYGGTATCIAQAVCSECGIEYGSLDPGNHGDNITSYNRHASCTMDGYLNKRICMDCDTVINPGTVEVKLGHDFTGMYRSDNNATCDGDGTKTAKCVRYGADDCTETDTVPDVGSALGHTFLPSDYLSNHDETCMNDGTKTAQCVRYGFINGCAATDTVLNTGSRKSHSMNLNESIPNHDATCETDGTLTAKCEWYGMDGCEATYTYPDEGSALGHSFTVYVANQDAACGVHGTKTAVCDRAGCFATDTVADTDSPLCHWYGEWTRAGEGAHRAVCRRDGCMYTAERACETATVSVGGVEMTFCPVCGAGLTDGNAAALAAEPMNVDSLPLGEWVVRRVTLADGAEALTFAYEYAVRPVKMTGVHRVAVPAAALEGLTTAEAAPFETDGKRIILTVDFSDAAQGDFVRVVSLAPMM